MKPNIIIINADDLGYGDLGCFGSSRNSTPRLDRMAQEGMKFTNFYAAAPLCSPSRAALLTGCYPKRIGLDAGENHGVLLPGVHIGLNKEEFTIPKMLKECGYSTKLIGKWHLGDQPEFLPLRHGFDSHFGLPYSNDMIPDHPGKVYSFPPLPLMRDDEVIETDPNQASLTDRYTSEAITYIKNNHENNKPFFLYLAHMYVHVPLYTPMVYHHLSQNGIYGAAVAHLDQSTGLILDTLDELGISENTLVVFTSDNGASKEGENKPLRGHKATTWEGGMREPCIMKWPGTIPENSECHELATMMDFLPTLAHFGDYSKAKDLQVDGYNISGLMGGKKESKTPYEAFFYYGCRHHKLEAVRSGKWKLHLIKKELYNLEKDVGEESNIYKEHPDVVRRLEQYAQKCREDIGDAHTGIVGKNCREPGYVENPVTLTFLDDMDPIIRAMYDLDDE